MERTVIDGAKARRLYATLRRYVAVDGAKSARGPAYQGNGAREREWYDGGRRRVMRWAVYIAPEERLVWRRPSFEEFVQLYGLEIRDEAA